jgi:hypothetical protein
MSYTDIYNTDPTNLSFGMPTVDPGAAVANVSQPAAPGLTPPAVNTPPVAGAPVVEGAAPAAGPGFFSQYGPAQFALGAIQTLGSLWNSFQQNKMAKESFKFQKEAYQTNLGNQEQSYNTALEGRITAQYATEGKSQKEADAYIDRHSL